MCFAVEQHFCKTFAAAHYLYCNLVLQCDKSSRETQPAAVDDQDLWWRAK